ncbi:serine/threonine protein kinase, negative regulator of sexual conjugation and meiosis [Mycena belliarum]|uniref:non-specific serine/threonine protein kinase n=1 Tax=Mycena belliarum TaxID=1033014 RepID=A0AAD6U855_9AGAR|nr:serine/threonine protein kinase, negative regulator of sexual conjugation and meiosis [Mycena belliae]
MSHSEALPNFLGETVDNGRLKIIERLGSGAYGIVYKALDTTSPVDRPVHYAVKCMKRYPVGTREASFQARELKLHKMVSNHPNVLTIHRHFFDGEHLFMVLDFCAGGDLFVAITEKHRFRRNTDVLRHAFVQLLDAVQHCHNNWVFHRDLKPENILCDNQGCNIRLADFGLSTQKAICSDHGLGSPFYMSPEAISTECSQDGYSTRHCDIWALGVILTNMICGRNPWKAAEPADECFASFLTDNDFLLRSLPISQGVNNILKRCFRLHPPARPSISQIRAEVLKLDTFFMSETELVHASDSQRAIAQYYADPTPEGELSSGSDRDLRDDPNTSSCEVSSVDPDEVYVYPMPPFDSPQLLLPPQFPGDSSSVSASDISSDGPTTPDTHSVDPIDMVEVPDLPGEQDIDKFAVFPSSDPSRIPVKSAKSGLASRNLWKRAMRRLKAMGI